MDNTSRDRLIEAWKYFIDENNVDILFDSTYVEVERCKHVLNTSVIFHISPIGESSTNAIVSIFTDIAKSAWSQKIIR